MALENHLMEPPALTSTPLSKMEGIAVVGGVPLEERVGFSSDKRLIFSSPPAHGI
jgi:hypothetical protein